MKEYFLSIALSSVLVSVISLLCPHGKGLEKAFRTTVAVVMILVIFSPITRALAGLDKLDLDGFDGIFDEEGSEQLTDKFAESFERYGADYVNAAIRSDVCNALGVKESNCRALASFKMQEGALCPKKITVILSGKAIWHDPHEIEDYVEEKYGCECAVAVE